MNNLYGVIDVGSNSVRLMLSKGTATLYKKVQITKLAEGLGVSLILNESAIKRTAQAVFSFYEQALEQGASKVYVFATAAVRQATNGQDFVDYLKNNFNIEISVVSGELEARLGVMGAVANGNGGIIDVGGGSTEVSVMEGGEQIYSKSLPWGAVKITEACGDLEDSATIFTNEKVVEFSNDFTCKFYAIGGTATTASALIQGLEVYDATKVHGHVISIWQLKELKQKLFSLSVEERAKLKGMQAGREGIIACGVSMLVSVMERLNLTNITVSENDNLEGYLLYVLSGGLNG